VTNLQELVYKQGQAGINKATVSVTFHNDDPKTGPAGYEDKEYIVVTRQVRAAARRHQPGAPSTGARQRVTPPAMPAASQIVIGGRNKYMINGQAAQPGWAAHAAGRARASGAARTHPFAPSS
jgi:structural maintenance of chromosome 2